MKLFKSAVMLILIFGLAGCGGEKFIKNPIDDIIKSMPTGRIFSIVLNDMDVQGSFFHEYSHQYKIIEETAQGIPEERITEWYQVEEKVFEQHVDDMGMELASRGEDGKLHKGASPPGFNNYVGNEKYGHWENRGGNSFWAFYGQYAFMSSMFRMMTYPVRRSYYDDYRGNYRGTGRSYYGPTTGGRSRYGTGSEYNSGRTNTAWNRNRSSFKQRVSNRTSRSNSRYGGSSSRSRGGGFGK